MDQTSLHITSESLVKDFSNLQYFVINKIQNTVSLTISYFVCFIAFVLITLFLINKTLIKKHINQNCKEKIYSSTENISLNDLRLSVFK